MIYILRYTLESKCVGISIALKDNQKKKTKTDLNCINGIKLKINI